MARGSTVENPTVSVVVPTWRRTEWLRRCLLKLALQTRPADEVIVVGRAEDTPTKQLVVRSDVWAPIKILRWVEVEDLGHVAPVRKGLAAASCDIVAFLDDDTEPEPDWLRSLLEPFADLRVGCVGGCVFSLEPPSKSFSDAGRMRWYGQFIGNIGTRKDLLPVDLDGAMEGNCAWRTSILREIRFDSVLDFDDASMYGLDLCLQARSIGYRVVYQPGARILHHSAPRDPGLDRKDRPRMVISYSRNYTYIGLKHLRGPRRLVFVLWWWLVGERASYGLATALYDMVRNPRSSMPLIAASFVGKWRGVMEWRGR